MTYGWRQHYGRGSPTAQWAPLAALLLLTACAGSGGAPRVAPAPQSLVSSAVKSLVEGKTASLQTPRELQAVALDYLRAAGAIVIDGGPSEFRLVALTATRTLTYCDTIPVIGCGIRVNGSNVAGERVSVQVELRKALPDGSHQVAFMGSGQADHPGHDRQRAVDTALRWALARLQ